ncbi:transposase [Streptomyces sp. NPDC056637]|uniref:transposase n=1 Tax=unclassified Streptomyces TaxID=2593676 RepID=UPI0036326D30
MPASPMLLGKLRVFTAPGFTTFTATVAGLVAQTGASTVTGMPTGAGLARAWPHDRAHASFSQTRWNVDNLGTVLAHLIVRTLLPQGAAITVAVDDTLFNRSGKKGGYRVAARRRRQEPEAGRARQELRGGRDRLAGVTDSCPSSYCGGQPL